MVPFWRNVKRSCEVRQELLSGHAITLVALGYLITAAGDNQLQAELRRWTHQYDWSKTNPEWNGLSSSTRIHKNRVTFQQWQTPTSIMILSS